MSLQASLHELRIILQGPVGQVRRLLQRADWNLLRALTEIAYNLVQGNVQLTKSQQAKLKRYRRFLAKLGNSKSSLASRHLLLTKTRNTPKILKDILRVVVKAVPWLKEWL